MDCGDPKATASQFTLDDVAGTINRKYNLNGGTGTVQFQVLVDPTGFSCVLSYSDVSHSTLTADLIRLLNGCRWKPAIVNGKPVTSSVNVVFTINSGRIYGQMKRMEQADLASLGDPVIYNKQFQYTNPSISSYNFTVWTKFNSLLPDNKSQAAVVDKSDALWYATARGLAKLDGNMFYPIGITNSQFVGAASVNAMAVDKDNKLWMAAGKEVYSSNGNSGWQVYDSVHLTIAGASHIVTNPEGELFFTNSKGLLILRSGRVRMIDQKVIPQMPSNNVSYAYYDTKQRLWIGTDRGSIMIDKRQKVTEFNDSLSPLDNACITNMAEDEQGNLYFSLHAYKKAEDDDNDEEGIAVLSTDGKWSHYNDKNSGMPANHVTSILYDKFEHALWIGTAKAGLVRFDLKDGWENYNNTNSEIPAYEIDQLAGDSKGTIYVATANGLVRINKK